MSGEPGSLLGRRRECAALDARIADAAGGRSASLVLHGEPGIGKTALLEYARSRASGCRILRVAGVEAEAELAFGGVHQLCAPFSSRLGHLPEPQRAALEIAFGLSAGRPPDRFLVGLAVLSLLAEAAEAQPLVCLVDDAQWLDQISAHTLAFVARRLLAERVVLLFTARDPIQGLPLQDLPRLRIEGLDDHDSRTLLASAAPGRVDDRVRDRILAEAHGNPLALLELPRELTAAQMTTQHLWLDDQPLANQIEKGFLRRLHSLAPDTQRLVLLAAADPVGDVVLVRKAAETLGIDVHAASAEAQAADLFTARTMVRFRHPLVRSAAYRSASTDERRLVHQALAEATNDELDPDRRAWHLASGAGVPDERVAVSLEHAAARAHARGGVAAAAAFLDRAAQLTPDPGRRSSRSLAAAQAKSQAGEFGDALELLDAVRLKPLDEHEQIMADLTRGRVLSSSRSASAGLPLLLDAAKQLESLDPVLATETYRDAIYAAQTAGRLPGDTGVTQVATAILAMSRPRDPSRSRPTPRRAIPRVGRGLRRRDAVDTAQPGSVWNRAHLAGGRARMAPARLPNGARRLGIRHLVSALGQAGRARRRLRSTRGPAVGVTTATVEPGLRRRLGDGGVVGRASRDAGRGDREQLLRTLWRRGGRPVARKGGGGTAGDRRDHARPAVARRGQGNDGDGMVGGSALQRFGSVRRGICRRCPRLCPSAGTRAVDLVHGRTRRGGGAARSSRRRSRGGAAHPGHGRGGGDRLGIGHCGLRFRTGE